MSRVHITRDDMSEHDSESIGFVNGRCDVFVHLMFSKNFFPQHSFERWARKFTGNLLCLVNYHLNQALTWNS